MSQDDIDKYDRTMREKPTYIGKSTQVSIGTAVFVAVSLFIFYLGIDRRMSAMEVSIKNTSKDRWTGGMQSEWVVETAKLSGWKWEGADTRSVQEKLKDN